MKQHIQSKTKKCMYGHVHHNTNKKYCDADLTRAEKTRTCGQALEVMR